MSTKGRRTALLIAVNLLLVGAVVKLLHHDQGNSGWLDSISSEGAMDWSDRYAADAGKLPDCPGCNVLMISLDIFRPDHMECLGGKREITPNMCDMAKAGTLFENFIVHAYQTPVSQMSIFTGRYPSSSGYVSFASTLPSDVPTFQEALQQAGYATTAMGSSFEVMTDMSGPSTTDGKRRFFKEGLNPSMSFGRGFDRFVFTGNRNVPTDAIPFLQNVTEEPFFLWLILGSLHWPYGDNGDPAKQKMFDDPNYTGPLLDQRLSFALLSRISGNTLYNDNGSTTALTPEDGAYINNRYDFGLWTVDEFIGEMMTAIPKEVLQNTLIVLHGVHGEDLGEHGYFGHYDIYDTEVRSTLIVLNPKHKTKKKRVTEQVEAVDLAPTMLEVLGLNPMPNIDGESFKTTLRTGKGDPDALAFFERIPIWEDIFRFRVSMPQHYVQRVHQVLDYSVPGDTGVRTLRWKLIHRRARAVEAQVSWSAYLTGKPLQRRQWELYDLRSDPTEQHNVVDQHPDVAAQLQAALLQWEAGLRGPVGDPRGAYGLGQQSQPF
jgi:arylsulfatase A-like enzyme